MKIKTTKEEAVNYLERFVKLKQEYRELTWRADENLINEMIEKFKEILTKKDKKQC